MFKVIIAGGRDFYKYDLLNLKCRELLLTNYKISDIEIVSGKARGADKLGEQFAEQYGIQVKEFPADWKRYGNAAGPIRNREMANYADALIAFWDGRSTGTRNMIETARELGLKVRIVHY